MSTPSLVILLMLIAAFSWWCTRRLTVRLINQQIVDESNERSLHEGKVPRGGGLVIVALLLGGMLAMAIVSQRWLVFSVMALLTLAWAALSWWDDRRSLSPRRRLLFQVVFTTLTMVAFGYVDRIQLNGSLVLWLPIVGAICTWIGIMWLTNLYNFMDGMDGLAACQTIIAAITLAFWFWQAGDPHISFVCLVLAAASYGFLLHNWQPARIFMGDVGSITIGAFFALMVIFGSSYQVPVISFVLLFGVFVADASLTIIRRIIKRERFWEPHRSHYYQRLALAGFSHASVVVAMSVLMLLCSLAASLSVINPDLIPWMIGAEVLMLLIAVMTAVHLEGKAKL